MYIWCCSTFCIFSRAEILKKWAIKTVCLVFLKLSFYLHLISPTNIHSSNCDWRFTRFLLLIEHICISHVDSYYFLLVRMLRSGQPEGLDAILQLVVRPCSAVVLQSLWREAAQGREVLRPPQREQLPARLLHPASDGHRRPLQLDALVRGYPNPDRGKSLPTEVHLLFISTVKSIINIIF